MLKFEKVKGLRPNQVIMRFDGPTRRPFMPAKSIQRNMDRALKDVGKQTVEAYVVYTATWAVEMVLKDYTDAKNWFASNKWKAEPLYALRKRSKNGLHVPVDGRVKLTLKSKSHVAVLTTTFQSTEPDEEED